MATETKKSTKKQTTATKKVAKTAREMKAAVFDVKGKETGSVALPESVFGVSWNPDFVHEVVVSMQSNARANTAHTKDRSEVRGGGRKPWRQKGTGRARHGSRRSPIWTGGGVTFGPRTERNYTKKINRSARAKALGAVLSKKYKDGDVIFVDTLDLSAPKTKTAREVLMALSKIKGAERLSQKKKNTALIVLPERNHNTEKSFRNFGNVVVEQTKDINPVELLTFKYIIFAVPDKTLEMLKTRVERTDAKKEVTTT